MKLLAVGLAISLSLGGAPALAQVGGPAHGPKAAVGGAASRPVTGAAVGGPANKGPSTGASVTTKSTSTGGTTTKPVSTPSVANTVTTSQPGAGKPKR